MFLIVKKNDDGRTEHQNKLSRLYSMQSQWIAWFAYPPTKLGKSRTIRPSYTNVKAETVVRSLATRSPVVKSFLATPTSLSALITYFFSLPEKTLYHRRRERWVALLEPSAGAAAAAGQDWDFFRKGENKLQAWRNACRNKATHRFTNSCRSQTK